MKDKLKNACKPAPHRFRYAVNSAVDEALHTSTQKKRLSVTARALIATALILAIIPSAVFGAGKLIGLLAKPVGNYGVELNIETTNTDYPEYVKMSVNIPDGFEEVEGTEGMKFHRLGDTDYTSGFSLFPMRYYDGGTGEVIGNVDSYEEVTVCGREAYRVDLMGEGVYSRLYINYAEYNVTLLVFYGKVTEDELNAFVGGISFVEGTASDHTELGEPFDERIKDDMVYTYNYKNIELDRDIVMTFRGFSERNNDDSVRYTAQISGVSVVDSLSGLENARQERGLYNDISGRTKMYDTEQLFDSDGRLLPRTVTVTRGGNGFDTTDTVISSEEKQQEIILIDITYTNLSDEDTMVYIPYDLEVFDRNSNGSFTPVTDIDPDNRLFSSPLCDREILYNSDPIDNVELYYQTMLKADETKTVTIGYRCCADMLDKAYLSIIDASSAGIIDPACPEESGEYIPNFILKVL